MSAGQIKRRPAFKQPWYYIIELARGCYTPGEERAGVALTRRLLRNVAVAPGVRCLDVGMEEGLVSILLERRGADVVGYDRVYSEERLGLVKDALGARFEVAGTPILDHTEGLWIGRGGPTPGVGMPLSKLPLELRSRGHAPFDVVVFSGVLYHVYDPLGSLAIVRGLVRNGGIVIVETAAIFDGRMSLNLNAASRLTPLAIWLPSLGCLDYLLRLVRLEPLEIAYFGRRRGRIAVACRAVDAPPADPQDDFIRSPLHEYELAEYLDWSALGFNGEPVDYAAPEHEPVNLMKAVRATPPHRPEAAEKRLDLESET